MTKAKKKLSVTLTRSTIGRLAAHKACAKGLGLRRISQTVELEDTPSIRGMIDKISYMVKVEGE